MRHSRTTPVLAGLAATALLLSGCAAAGGADQADGTLSVVASTNVYGDLARSIGGDQVEVTSIIDRMAQDPHSYEATARDKLAVSKADLVLENGGGYDTFMHTLADDTGVDHHNIITAVELSPLPGAEDEAPHDPAATDADAGHTGHGHAEHGHGGFNEHVWYDLSTMAKVADTVAAKLSALDPEQADTFKANAGQFQAGLDKLQAEVDGLAAAAGGEAVAATDPVPLHLFDALGLENKTPDDFMEAAEEGSDASPQALKEAEDLVTGGSVRFVAYNEQTEGPQTQRLRLLAEKAGIAVVDFTETLPEGQDYLGWMAANLHAVEKALRG
ncbi:metal ABC transporter solute-binding protein, Zn/Mn family [Arthrobacter sulfonylureivorans]|uniref:Zinc ABC transporter substrate-binding protein n=1 Tax=Arthrobacter sulfonylureivorans TaxID=2486855 RepID=A0ABY3WFR1_9MICC|nr:zinc ABC transporter substrate-binding protein [Arthrobacter sulfonylureivorans]UNK47177.1 zinc ABC transporter substrate-binding protein [Arthrobacter sulfonylureivorans]